MPERSLHGRIYSVLQNKLQVLWCVFEIIYMLIFESIFMMISTCNYRPYTALPPEH